MRQKLGPELRDNLEGQVTEEKSVQNVTRRLVPGYIG